MTFIYSINANFAFNKVGCHKMKACLPQFLIVWFRKGYHQGNQTLIILT